MLMAWSSGMARRSSPPRRRWILAAIAAHTSRIRLLTTVTVLSVLDPVRVAEDYTMLDHLSAGRLELINDRSRNMFSACCFVTGNR